MKKRFSSKLFVFVVLIAIGIFSILGLNEFVSSSNQEEPQEEIAAEEYEKQVHLNDKPADEGVIEKIKEDKPTQPAIENEQKTKEDSQEKVIPKIEDKTTETQSEKASKKQESPPLEPSKAQKEQVEQQKETDQVVQEKSDKVMEEKSKDQEVKEEIPPPEAKKNTVLVTIVGPKDMGIILNTSEIEIGDSDTVLQCLQRVTRENNIQMEFRGTHASAYVEGINNIYEFDRGAGSGWMYSVNGVFPNKGAGVVVVKPDDQIRWLYTEDLGKDIGAGQ